MALKRRRCALPLTICRRSCAIRAHFPLDSSHINNCKYDNLNRFSAMAHVWLNGVAQLCHSSYPKEPWTCAKSRLRWWPPPFSGRRAPRLVRLSGPQPIATSHPIWPALGDVVVDRGGSRALRRRNQPIPRKRRLGAAGCDRRCSKISRHMPQRMMAWHTLPTIILPPPTALACRAPKRKFCGGADSTCGR